MKTLLIFLLLNLPIMAQESSFDKLYNLYSDKKYFKFISQFKETESTLSKHEKNICNVFYNSLIYKPAESEKWLTSELITNTEIHDSVKRDLYSTSVINNIWLGDYKKSVEYSKIVLKNYSAYIKEKDKEDYENSLVIWESMSGVGKQEVIRNSETKLNMKRDLAGLYNIPVTYKEESFDFIFDTGANFSTITESYAKKFDLVFTEGKIKVGAITGLKIDANIAWAKSFFIGNMEIKNALFLVLKDEDLSFAGGLYKINGIIGFPVIAEMGELIISKDGGLTVPLTASITEKNNLLIDGFNPLVEVDYKNNPMCFTFDTGAKTTMLYVPFLKDFEKEITAEYQIEDIKFGGAGGDVKVPGYNLKNIELKIADDFVNLAGVSLIAKSLKENEEVMYGNLGQDFISKFDKMILNFKYMSIDFR
jgi:predicted aspartyl protease